VPDSVDGRFEMLALHAFLVLNRLKRAPEAARFAQHLFDTMFADLDRSMREMGAADIGVARHVKAMARGFYGRIAAYENGLSEGDAVLEAALRRNLYGTAQTAPSSDQLAAIAAYLHTQATALAAAPLSVFLAGEIPFTAPEEC
jgi:cytochrome b pre-mRNA-processing protein 3